MKPAPFEGLTLLCRGEVCPNGRVEVCRTPAGEEVIRLCVTETTLQRSLLRDRPVDLPVRMQGDVLELLLSPVQGQTLAEWVYFRNPDLGQRRQACLWLLGQLLAHPVPAALLALSARAENLRLGEQTACLAWFPRLTEWRPGQGQRAAVQAVSCLMTEILTRGLEEEAGRFPPELRLVLLRAQTGAYADWQALQQDLTALPDTLEPHDWWVQTVALPLRAWWQKVRGPMLRVLVGFLVAAALLSLVQTIQIRQIRRQESWPGMAWVGDQSLGKEDATA